MVLHPRPVKPVDNAGTACRDLTRALHDQDEASIVPVVLADDECFREKARLVSAADDRVKRAQLEAKSYTPYRGAHRDLIVQLLLDTAEERWGTDPPGRRYFFANWGRRAVWAEPEALGELDPCRVRTRWPMLVEGAQCLARFGAFSCIACGMAIQGERTL